MSYDCGISKDKGFIRVVVTGKQTLEANIELANACIDACRKHGVSRVLLDITGLAGQPGTMADYELAKLLSAWETNSVVARAALVEKKEDLPAGKFFETAARNRNINIRVFSDLKEAENWLTS